MTYEKWFPLILQKNPLPRLLSRWQRVLKSFVVSFWLLQLSLHNHRAALMPIMVGMMVSAVMVVCVEVHKPLRRFSREVFLYSTLSRSVNEFT